MLRYHKEHLTLLGLKKILAIKRYLNLGLSDEIKTNFPQINSIERPVVAVQILIEPNWFSGSAGLVLQSKRVVFMLE